MKVYIRKYFRVWFALLYTAFHANTAHSSDLNPKDLEPTPKRSFLEIIPSHTEQTPLKQSHKKQKREDIMEQYSMPSSSKEVFDFSIFREKDVHFYLPPLSTAMLKRIFDRPNLSQFFLRILSDIPNLTEIKMVRPSPEESISEKIPFYFMFEGLKKQKKVAIFLARDSVENFHHPLYRYSGLDCEWFAESENKLPDDVRSQYNIFVYIDLVDINWDKPFSRNYHLYISDDEKAPKELSLYSPKLADPPTQRAFYKPYFMDCINQPQFPFLNEPEVCHFSLKENLLYTLRHAYLFLSIPPHIKEYPEFQELFDTFDARDWTIQEWVEHANIACQERGWITSYYEKKNKAWDFIAKLWPLGIEKPQNFDTDYLMFVREQIPFERSYSALKDVGELLNIPRDRLKPYLDSRSFPIAEYRREVCFRDKSEILINILNNIQAITIAKNLRIYLADSLNQDEVLDKMRTCASDPVFPICFPLSEDLIGDVQNLLDHIIPKGKPQTPSS